MAIDRAFNDFYFTGSLDLFRLRRDGETDFLPSTVIKDLAWKSLEQASMNLVGMLPSAAKLLELREGDTLEVLRKRVGPRDEYSKEAVFLRISGIEQLSWQLPDFFKDSLEEEAFAKLRLTLVGRLEWLIEE